MLKHKVLDALRKSGESYISGSLLAKKYKVSRTAVWKAVCRLREEGYVIETKRKSGYMLVRDIDEITDKAIASHLTGRAKNLRIKVVDTTHSTNNDLKIAAASGEKEEVLLVAKEQTGGRGRMGRSFYSPTGTGVYMSVLLRPELKIEETMLLTALVAVATASSIEDITGKSPLIKWVNDLYLNGKKIAGILTEGGIGGETGRLEYVVVGVGINIVDSPYPTEISDRAGSLFGSRAPIGFCRSRLIAQIINNIYKLIPDISMRSFIPEYKSRSFILGQRVLVHKEGRVIPAVALDITDSAGLTVQYEENGRIETLTANDISIRPTQEDL